MAAAKKAPAKKLGKKATGTPNGGATPAKRAKRTEGDSPKAKGAKRALNGGAAAANGGDGGVTPTPRKAKREKLGTPTPKASGASAASSGKKLRSGKKVRRSETPA